MPGPGATTRASVAFIAVVVGLAALRATASVTLPLAFAVFVVAVIWPLQHWLERFVPRGVALLGTLSALLALATVVVVALVVCVERLAAGAPDYEDALRELVGSLGGVASQIGIDVDPSKLDVAQLFRDGRLGGRRLATELGAAAGAVILIAAFVVLGLLEVERWRAKLGELGGDRREAIDVARTIACKFRRYLVTRTMTSALTGLLTGLVTWALGVDFPIVWAVSSFLLNYIPTLGSLIAMAPPVAIALLQFDGPWRGLVTLGSLGAIQLGIGNYVDPVLQGRTLRLSPLVVLFAIAFWGFVWGLPGALLGVPLTVAVAMVCQQFPGARWVSELLADDAPSA